MSETGSEGSEGDGQAPTRTSVRGRTTSRIVLPKAARQKQQSRRVWLMVAAIALVTSLILFAVLIARPGG